MKKYVVKPKLTDKGFPTHNSHYHSAHTKTDKMEKAKFPKGYEKMKRVDAKLPKNELAGKNLKSGKIEVSRKVPKQYRKEVAFHERTESKLIKKMSGKKR